MSAHRPPEDAHRGPRRCGWAPPERESLRRSGAPDSAAGQRRRLRLVQEDRSGRFATPAAFAAATMPSLPESGRFVVALFDCEADEAGELAFKAGDTIALLDDSDDGWSTGGATQGCFAATSTLESRARSIVSENTLRHLEAR